MLPKLKNKLFLTPELSPTFTAKDDDLNQLLGIITRIADGQGLVSDSGAHGHRGYDEDIMFTWVGAAVDIPYKVYRLLGNLGAKLYFFRMEFKEKTEDLLLEQSNEDFNCKIKTIKDSLFDYLKWFEIGPDMIIVDKSRELPKMKWDYKRDEELAKRYVSRLAILLSHLRCVAQTWETKDTQGSDYAYSVSQPEDPSRAMTVLYNLARGHALLTGRNYITKEQDISIIIKTVLSTAQIERVSLFSLLIANNGKLTTSQITEFLNISKPTALRTMSEFKAIGLVEEQEFLVNGNKIKQIVLDSKFSWFLSGEFEKLRDDFTPTDNREYINDNKKEDQGCKEKSPPIITNSSLSPSNNDDDDYNNKESKEETFWQIYKELEQQQQQCSSPPLIMEIDKITVSGQELKNCLISSGKFFAGDAFQIIEDMLKKGKLEKVAFDTYKRKGSKVI
jgi:hypothetical protein